MLFSLAFPKDYLSVIFRFFPSHYHALSVRSYPGVIFLVFPWYKDHFFSAEQNNLPWEVSLASMIFILPLTHAPVFPPTTVQRLCGWTFFFFISWMMNVGGLRSCWHHKVGNQPDYGRWPATGGSERAVIRQGPVPRTDTHAESNTNKKRLLIVPTNK